MGSIVIFPLIVKILSQMIEKFFKFVIENWLVKTDKVSDICTFTRFVFVRKTITTCRGAFIVY